jgi:hypothetical protein
MIFRTKMVDTWSQGLYTSFANDTVNIKGIERSSRGEGRAISPAIEIWPKNSTTIARAEIKSMSIKFF